MALETIHIRQLIIVVHMARNARSCGVLSSQCKLRSRMIERCRFPSVHRMALCAGGGKSQRCMIWIGGACIVRLMAVDTILMQPCIHIIDMTAGARHCLMCPEQSKSCCTMIECRRGPHHCCVALIAGMSKLCRDVVGICRFLIVCLVTRIAICIGQLIIAVYMAILALHRKMFSC